jgi:hypothetical protein
MRDGYQHKMKEIFIAREELHDYSNGHHFGSHVTTRVCCFESHASCIAYLNNQLNCPTF